MSGRCSLHSAWTYGHNASHMILVIQNYDMWKSIKVHKLNFTFTLGPVCCLCEYAASADVTL